MSTCFISDNELAHFDRGFKAGVYATMEEVIKRFPEMEDNFYDITETVLVIIEPPMTEDEEFTSVMTSEDWEDEDDE